MDPDGFLYFVMGKNMKNLHMSDLFIVVQDKRNNVLDFFLFQRGTGTPPPPLHFEIFSFLLSFRKQCRDATIEQFFRSTCTSVP